MKRWKVWKPDLEETFRASGRLVRSGILLVILSSAAYRWNKIAFCVLLGAGLLLCGTGFFIMERFWRCPKCGSKLPSLKYIDRLGFCPACGAKLEKE
ncbi:MAG: hypothetical protein IJ452_04375 [Butyricicoccus sp.]|nr:hypothetical protein [Butyricicoccus sp.]MBQ8585504.1 hypothetical protein [Butyricicoccus sp.]